MPILEAKLGNSVTTYGAVAKLFHWLTALLIVTIYPLGLVANDWPYDTSAQLAAKATLFSIHKTLGITVFFVALLRILWALSQPKPGPLHADRKVETWLAELVHWLLYISIVLVPLTGWIDHAATTGFAPIWWPLGQDLPFVPKSEAVAHLFGGLHNLFTNLLLGAFVLHVAGAVKHQVIDRDMTLKRMLPGTAAVAMTETPHSYTPVLAAFAIFAAAVAFGFASAPDGGSPADPAPQLAAQPSDWTVQDGTLGLAVNLFGAPVKGSFADWTASIAFDPDAPGPDMGSVTVDIAIPSLTLGSVTADALKPEFFDADTYPTARYVAAIRAGETENTYLAEGMLTLKGVEKPVTRPAADCPARSHCEPWRGSPRCREVYFVRDAVSAISTSTSKATVFSSP